ncbi:MAG: DEAD/DEAH box helicase, partial [Bdellovibrionota bacterium]
MATRPLSAEPHIAPAAREKLRAEISAALGREVFFLGEVDGKGIVRSVTALARGSDEQVPAIYGQARAGDVVLHNHPSVRPGEAADLRPSEADLHVASVFGNEGVGFFIIDNEAEYLYRVVEPARPESRPPPIDEGKVASFLGPEGALAEALAGFESRKEQQEMARAAARAMNGGLVLAVEAGTGVGKSLAYLVPALEKSRLERRRVVVSTATKNLQDQLLTKDIPLLERALGEDVRAALVMGRSNYVCKRKAAEAAQRLAEPLERNLFDEEGGKEEELREVLRWAGRSPTGMRTDLPLEVSPSVWEKVESASDQTLRTACPFYNDCFYYNSRRKSADADILIVNHHLLLADLAVRRELGQYNEAAVLPPFRDLVVDEAHNLEEAASDALSVLIGPGRVERLLARLLSRRDEGRGLLALLELRFKKHLPLLDAEAAARLFDPYLPRARDLVREARGRSNETFPRIAALALRLAGGTGEESRGTLRLRITPEREESPLFEELLGPLRDLSHDLSRVSAALSDLLRDAGRAAAGVSDERVLAELRGVMVETASVQGRLQTLCDDFRSFESASQEEVCRWIELSRERRGETRAQLASAPIE